MKIVSKGHTATLTDEEALDIIDTAGYGINYWATGPCVVTDSPVTYAVMHTDENGDGKVTTTVLTKADIEKAIGRLLDDDFNVNDRIIGYIRNDDIDSEAGDVIIQAAVFGRIIYG